MPLTYFGPGWHRQYSDSGPGIESHWEWDFPHLSILALGLTQPPVKW